MCICYLRNVIIFSLCMISLCIAFPPNYFSSSLYSTLLHQEFEPLLLYHSATKNGIITYQLPINSRFTTTNIKPYLKYTLHSSIESHSYSFTWCPTFYIQSTDSGAISPTMHSAVDWHYKSQTNKLRETNGFVVFQQSQMENSHTHRWFELIVVTAYIPKTLFLFSKGHIKS